MNSPVQEIKERLGIEEIVSSYIKLEKVGSSLKARCPFHNEKTPSFFVSTERGTYYCFGCAAKGDIFTFVQEFEGLDFKGSLKLLADRAGVKLGQFNQEEESEKERIYRIMEEATLYFVKNLASEKRAIDYLISRGLKESTVVDFRIGFAPLEWRLLTTHLRKTGFSDKDIELAGLAKHPDDGTKEMYDRFRGRVMFPISDSSGRVIAFSGRLLDDDGKSAKYLNSPDTPIFQKSAVLYGLDKAKESIKKNNFSILVEGQLDLILSHQAGFKNTVASSGTALSDTTVTRENLVTNLGLVRRLSENIVLAYDADRAGQEASGRAGRIALSLGMDVKVAKLPEGQDPADIISGPDGLNLWREAIRNSVHLIEAVLNRVIDNSKGDQRKMGREIKEKVLPYVNSLSSSIEKMHFIKKISDISSIPESALKEDLEKIFTTEDAMSPAMSSESKKIRRDYIERRILGIILWQKSLASSKLDTEVAIDELSEITGASSDKLLAGEPSEKEDLIFEAEVSYGDREDLDKEIAELMGNLREEHYKAELFTLMQELNLREGKGGGTDSMDILKKINELNQKIQNIKSGRFNK